MIITRKSESRFEIDFDESEVQDLSDVNDIFDVIPTDFIRQSVEDRLNFCNVNRDKLIDKLQDKFGERGIG